jgi:hypothetical protein
VSRKAGRATPASRGSYSKHFLSNESAQHLKGDVARYRAAYLGFVKEPRQAQPDCGETLAAIYVHVSLQERSTRRLRRSGS